ncbi:MAG: DUF3383 family protein [Myxococcota bacterium]
MPSTHSDTITVSIALSDLPPSRRGFSTPLLLVPLAANGLGGGAVRSVTFSSIDEAQTARTASEISAETLARVTTLFAQRDSFGRTPDRIIVGNADLAASPTPETYADAYDVMRNLGLDFYAVYLESRTAADILGLAAQVEAVGEHLLGVVLSDVEVLTAGLPAGLTALGAYERTVAYFHDVATAHIEVGHMAKRLMFNPDEISASWRGQVDGVAGLATALTQTQKDAARANNVNLPLPFGDVEVFIDPGYNARGRPIYEIVTADWLRARVREDIAAEVNAHEQRGAKIVLDATGIATIQAIVEGRLEQGERVGHFVTGQTTVSASSIDVATEKISITGSGQRATAARLFDFNFQISADPVVVGA